MENPAWPSAKLYGERHTGTKYLTGLIHRELELRLLRGVVERRATQAIESDVATGLARRLGMPESEARADLYFQDTFSRNLGWKHTLVEPAERLKTHAACTDDLLFLTLTKNPYAWLLSLHRRPYHHYGPALGDFRTFLTMPWRTVGRENAPGEFSSPVEMWNAKNASYRRLGDGLPVLHIRYEDLLADPDRILTDIQEKSGCRRRPERAAPGADDEEASAFYRSYYLEEQWRKRLSAIEIGLINERLDDDLRAFFRYEKLNG